MYFLVWKVKPVNASSTLVCLTYIMAGVHSVVVVLHEDDPPGVENFNHLLHNLGYPTLSWKSRFECRHWMRG
jgi:hypothetical protein